jgi:hypothetical protein
MGAVITITWTPESETIDEFGFQLRRSGDVESGLGTATHLRSDTKLAWSKK